MGLLAKDCLRALVLLLAVASAPPSCQWPDEDCIQATVYYDPLIHC